MNLCGHQLKVHIAALGRCALQVFHIQNHRAAGLGGITERLVIGQGLGKAGGRALRGGDLIIHQNRIAGLAVLQDLHGVIQIVQNGFPMRVILAAFRIQRVHPVDQRLNTFLCYVLVQSGMGYIGEQRFHLRFQIIVIIKLELAQRVILAGAVSGRGANLQIVRCDWRFKNSLVIPSVLLIGSVKELSADGFHLAVFVPIPNANSIHMNTGGLAGRNADRIQRAPLV